MPSDSLPADSALVHSDIEIDPELLARYTGAATIVMAECWAEDGGGWTHRLHFADKQTSYDKLSEAMVAIEIHKKSRCFTVLLDDAGRTSGKISINPAPLDPTAFKSMRPWPPGPSDLLIPGLERLSKELKVDFVVDVHGRDGKRHRKQSSTVYEELPAPHAAKAALPPKKAKAQPRHGDGFAEKALDAIHQSHKEAMQSKDETIRALTNALVLKDELTRTQAALIGALQRNTETSRT